MTLVEDIRMLLNVRTIQHPQGSTASQMFTFEHFARNTLLVPRGPGAALQNVNVGVVAHQITEFYTMMGPDY